MQGLAVLIAIGVGYVLLMGLIAVVSGLAEAVSKTASGTADGLAKGAKAAKKSSGVVTLAIKERLHRFFERKYGRAEIAADLSIDPLIKRDPAPIIALRSEIAIQESYRLPDTPPAAVMRSSQTPRATTTPLLAITQMWSRVISQTPPRLAITRR